MTSQTRSTVSRIATLRKQAGTWLWRFVFYPMTTCMHALMLAVALPVLAVWLALDFLPKRRGSSPSTSRTPQHPRQGTPARKLPILLHERGKFFAINPDGSKVEIDPLLFSEHFRQCSAALAAAMVYEKTKIAVDENR